MGKQEEQLDYTFLEQPSQMLSHRSGCLFQTEPPDSDAMDCSDSEMDDRDVEEFFREAVAETEDSSDDTLLSASKSEFPTPAICPKKPKRKAKASRREPKPYFFVCGLNGCEEVLSREFYAVRHHIRYSKRHLGSYVDFVSKYPCPFEGCTFKNEGQMRVAEHVCSDKHFDARVHCYGVNCMKEFNGRQYSLKRHRDGENGSLGACKCCEGCNAVFKSGAERTLHESQCTDALAARTARYKWMKEDETESLKEKKWRYMILKRVQTVVHKEGTKISLK